MSESVIQIIVSDEDARGLVRKLLELPNPIQDQVLIENTIVKTQTRTVTTTTTIRVIAEGTRREVFHE